MQRSRPQSPSRTSGLSRLTLLVGGFVSGKALAAGFTGAMFARWDRWLAPFRSHCQLPLPQPRQTVAASSH